MIEEELPRVPSKGWAEMIRKVYLTLARGRDILIL